MCTQQHYSCANAHKGAPVLPQFNYEEWKRSEPSAFTHVEINKNENEVYNMKNLRDNEWICKAEERLDELDFGAFSYGEGIIDFLEEYNLNYPNIDAIQNKYTYPDTYDVESYENAMIKLAKELVEELEKED